MSDGLDLDAIEARVRRVFAAAPVEYRWTSLDDMGTLVEVDVPALVSRLREAETQLANVRGLLDGAIMVPQAQVRRALGRLDGSEAAAVSLLSGIPRDELDDLGGVPESEVPARRRGKPGGTEPDTRGYMGGV